MFGPVVVLFTVSLLAFVLSVVCGGGAGLLLIPVLGHYLPISSVPAALSLGTAGSSASRIIAFHAQIRWSMVRVFVPASLPGVWLGSWLLQFVNPLYLELLMGLFLVSNLRPLFAKPKPQVARANHTAQLVIVGFLVGFVSGMTGAVGLLFNSFYLQYGLTKEEIVATRAANEVVLQVVKLVLYGLFGLLTKQTLGLGASIAVAAILSSVSMKWLLPKLSFELFRRIGYGAMVLSGVALLGQAGATLTAQNKGQLTWAPISHGVETKIQWARRSFSFEFVYDEGFEYEQVIGLADLPEDKRAFVHEHSAGADQILLEEVFGWNEHGYELYVRRGNQTEQFEF
jgi:uncharacterized membrane protein YfcA